MAGPHTTAHAFVCELLRVVVVVVTCSLLRIKLFFSAVSQPVTQYSCVALYHVSIGVLGSTAPTLSVVMHLCDRKNA
jgi:hypothetical protein